MYVQDLRISGIKLIEELNLDFKRDGEPRMWTVLLGENGTCKTTVLQCIALAAAGASKANQLLPNAASLRTIGAKSGLIAHRGSIDVTFGLPFDDRRLVPIPEEGSDFAIPVDINSKLTLRGGWNELAGVSRFGWNTANRPPEHTQVQIDDPLVEIRGKSLPRYFVAGYGISRTLPFPNSTQYPVDITTDRLRSLFDGDWRLVATDFVGKFIGEAGRSYESTLRSVLIASGLLPDMAGLMFDSLGAIARPEDTVDAHEFVEKDGTSVPATWLSQGYRSTIAWVADLVGQIFLDDPERNPAIDPSEFTGLVLVDELDLHLHPRWQRRIVKTLKTVFPKLQFIATTHSPLVLAGLEADEIVHLKRNEEMGIVTETNTTNPAFLTPTELLQEFFDLDDALPSEIGQQMHQYMVLATNPFRDDDEDKELHSLHERLVTANAPPAIKPTPRKAASGNS